VYLGARLPQSSDPTPRGAGDAHIAAAEIESRKIDGLPSDVAARPIGSVGIVGAGTMRSGIAIACATAGMSGMKRYRELFGPMHWEPAPLLERRVSEDRSLADWNRQRSGDPT
jgi:hypothetical protein